MNRCLIFAATLAALLLLFTGVRAKVKPVPTPTLRSSETAKNGNPITMYRDRVNRYSIEYDGDGN